MELLELEKRRVTYNRLAQASVLMHLGLIRTTTLLPRGEIAQLVQTEIEKISELLISIFFLHLDLISYFILVSIYLGNFYGPYVSFSVLPWSISLSFKLLLLPVEFSMFIFCIAYLIVC